MATPKNLSQQSFPIIRETNTFEIHVRAFINNRAKIQNERIPNAFSVHDVFECKAVSKES